MCNTNGTTNPEQTVIENSKLVFTDTSVIRKSQDKNYHQDDARRPLKQKTPNYKIAWVISFTCNNKQYSYK